jgi:H+-transporting ATPase
MKRGYGEIGMVGLGVMGRNLMLNIADHVFSVIGHLMIFGTRTRGPFWSQKPAEILVAAVLGTQFVATMFAVFGIFMAPIGWTWALVVWVYALVWFLISDRVKLAAYRVFDASGPAVLARLRRGEI